MVGVTRGQADSWVRWITRRPMKDRVTSVTTDGDGAAWNLRDFLRVCGAEFFLFSLSFGFERRDIRAAMNARFGANRDRRAALGHTRCDSGWSPASGSSRGRANRRSFISPIYTSPALAQWLHRLQPGRCARRAGHSIARGLFDLGSIDAGGKALSFHFRLTLETVTSRCFAGAHQRRRRDSSRSIRRRRTTFFPSAFALNPGHFGGV